MWGARVAFKQRPTNGSAPSPPFVRRHAPPFYRRRLLRWRPFVRRTRLILRRCANNGHVAAALHHRDALAADHRHAQHPSPPPLAPSPPPLVTAPATMPAATSAPSVTFNPAFEGNGGGSVIAVAGHATADASVKVFTHGVFTKQRRKCL